MRIAKRAGVRGEVADRVSRMRARRSGSRGTGVTRRAPAAIRCLPRPIGRLTWYSRAGLATLTHGRHLRRARRRHPSRASAAPLEATLAPDIAEGELSVGELVERTGHQSADRVEAPQGAARPRPRARARGGPAPLLPPRREPLEEVEDWLIPFLDCRVRRGRCRGRPCSPPGRARMSAPGATWVARRPTAPYQARAVIQGAQEKLQGVGDKIQRRSGRGDQAPAVAQGLAVGPSARAVQRATPFRASLHSHTSPYCEHDAQASQSACRSSRRQDQRMARRSLRRALPHGRRGRRDDARLDHDRLPARALRRAAGRALRALVPHPGVGRRCRPSRLPISDAQAG